MKLYRTIKNAGKKVLISGLALTALAIGAEKLNAQTVREQNINPAPIVQALTAKPLESIIQEKQELKEKKEAMPERKLILDFASPVSSFEANSNLWYSANQLFGKGSDFLGTRLELDKSLLGRFTLLSADVYRSLWLRMASHELSHIKEGKKYGSYESRFEMNSLLDLANNFIKKFNYKPTDQELVKERIAGINQDEFNSYNLFKNSIDRLAFDDGISFLLSKLWDIGYNLYPCESSELGDVSSYVNHLNKKGISLSTKDHLLQSVLADALSIQTWDSLKAVYNYFKTGERTIKSTALNLSGTTVTLPLINHYLTENGSFYNLSSFIRLKEKKLIELSLGIDADFIGGGKVDCLRFGGQYSDLDLGEHKYIPTVSPFAYINTTKSLNYQGFSVGIEAKLPVTKTTKLRAKVEYNHDDMIENRIKGKDEGLNFVAGLYVQF
ncbi:MAG: hypothetical protein Q8N77_05405 [Nanoarchaeota archaeon]|nr:hypothetical protein [Nanoarchaeota archaeon]